MVGFGIKDSSFTANEGERKKGKRKKNKKELVGKKTVNHPITIRAG